MKTINSILDRMPLAEFMILLSVGGSMAFSIYLFTEADKKSLALFVGLWPTTLLGIVNYINIKFKK